MHGRIDAQKNNPRRETPAAKDQLAEILVLGQKQSVVRLCAPHHGLVADRRCDLSDIEYIVSVSAQEGYEPGVNTFVCEQAHD